MTRDSTDRPGSFARPDTARLLSPTGWEDSVVAQGGAV
jgi:hypothetical protein